MNAEHPNCQRIFLNRAMPDRWPGVLSVKAVSGLHCGDVS